MVIFVIGFMGSDRRGLAQKLADERGYKFIDLDEEIEKKDGRSILRICMTMGEHEYRNKEYEALVRVRQEENVVVACGDGIVLDPMNVEILKKNAVVVADADASPQELWDACQEKNTPPYAFMLGSDISVQKDKFYSLYEARKELYIEFM